MAEGDRPIELRGTLADDEAALRKGKAGSLIAVSVLGLAVVGGLLYLMGGEDQARVYGDLGKQINGLKQASFDQFWSCALQGEDLRDVTSNTELMARLDGLGRDGGRRYAENMRKACKPQLENIGPALDTLIVPPELQAHVRAMSEAAASLRTATSGFIVYLDDPELKYDDATARPHVSAMTRAWYDFKKAHGEANQVIKQQKEK
jgi:hypothetical protein